MTRRILPYGAWPSPISAALVAGAQVVLGWPELTREALWWTETRPQEGGRVALLRRDRRHGRTVEVTRAGFSLRTRAQEYGGRAYAVAAGVVVGCNQADQRLYRLPGVTPGWALTAESDGALRYAEPVIDLARQRVLAIREDHRRAGEPETTVVAIPLDGAGGAGEILCGGHDFVAAPALSADGRRLAWLSWDHPDMPWDATCLWVAELDAAGRPGSATAIAGGSDEAVLQPLWLVDGSLVFASDRTGFWNLWRWDGRSLACLREDTAEYAGPLWSLGQRWYAAVDARTLAVTVARDGFTQLAWLDVASGALRPVALPGVVEVAEPTACDGQVAVLAAAADAPSALLLAAADGAPPEALVRGAALPFEPGWIARPRPLWFASAGGRPTHAFHYPPTSPECRGPEAAQPPLIVRSHGGPTSAARAALSLGTQFWTSRGFAVVDVNYGGSTGFGRAYRRRLDGQWGVVDVEDCLAAARHLVAQGLADPARLAIRGGSAAGFTTLCALTFHDLFKVGASYYGIGDLEALARDTHKFESRYLDRLIGPLPEARPLYRARSPLHHVDRLSCPVIFFQGLDDAAVPPSQAEAMVAALRAKGLPVAYLAFAGEGHGFRKAETIIAAQQAEHSFFCHVLGIVPAEGLTPLPDDLG